MEENAEAALLAEIGERVSQFNGRFQHIPKMQSNIKLNTHSLMQEPSTHQSTTLFEVIRLTIHPCLSPSKKKK